MSEQFIFQPDPLIDAFDVHGNWVMDVSNCASCHNYEYRIVCRTSKGNYCLRCAEESLREAANELEMEEFSAEYVVRILRTAVPMSLTLIFLWRYKDIKGLFSDPSLELTRLFHQLLVQKLNFTHRNPLAQLICQAAHEACMLEGKHLLPHILRLANSTRQLLPKVILTAGKLAPEDKIVQNMLENAARSTIPEIREHVAMALKNCELAWAKYIFNQLWKYLPPEAKKRIGEKSALMQLPPTVKVPAIPDLVIDNFPDIDPEIYQKLVIETENNYSFTQLNAYYNHYLYQFFENPGFKKKYNLERSKYRKADYVHGLAIIFSSKALFLHLYSLFSDLVKKIFEKVLWMPATIKISAIENEFKVSLIATISGGMATLYPEYQIFRAARENYFGYYTYSEAMYNLCIPETLKLQFKTYFPLPAPAQIVPLDQPKGAEFIYEDQARTVEQISIYVYYLGQKYLNYTSNGRVLKDSLKQMVKHCQIKEFYESAKGDLAFLKTNFIIEFLNNYQSNEKNDPLKNFKAVFDAFFHKNESNFNLIPSLFHAIRRLATSSEWFTLEFQPKGPYELFRILKEFPIQKWISIENLQNYFFYNGIFYRKEDALSVNSCYQKIIYPKYGYGYVQHPEYPPFDAAVYYELYVMTIFKAMMFFLGSFGIVDLAYQLPENKKYQRGKDPYLSPYDGLMYIRLTELGAYILGRKSDYQLNAVPDKTFKLTLDDKNLLVFLEGENSIKRIILEKLGERVNANCYRINSKTFLTGCQTVEDIRKKVDLFKKNISAKPAPIWQEFFSQIEEKINPLQFKNDLLVFKINPNNELLQVLVKDEILKNCILKAENYHIIIEQKNFNKIKKRLEDFGYFIDLFLRQENSKDYY